MPLPDSDRRLLDGIVPSTGSRQHTAFQAGSPTDSTQNADVVLDAVLTGNPVSTTYEALCRDPETARWIERVRRIRGRA